MNKIKKEDDIKTKTRLKTKAKIDIKKQPKQTKKDNRTDIKKIGDLGENIAVVFLEKRGFQIIDRNYRNKIGEIDIIAQKDDFYYVVEVKTLKIPFNTRISKFWPRPDSGSERPTVSIIRDGEGTIDWLKPEINLTKAKINKIKHTALKYCMDFNIKEESLKFIGMCISLSHSGTRVTKSSLISCKIKVLPLAE